VTWTHHHPTITDDNGIEVWATIEPFNVGPLRVEGWVKNDGETRRGVFAEVKITSGEVALFTGQLTKPVSPTGGTAYDAVLALIETGLTEAHARILTLYVDASTWLRTVAQIRDEMDYVVLSSGSRGQRLTRDIAELCMLVYDSDAKRPAWLEKVTQNVAVAYNSAGVPVARIAYDPDDPRNLRSAGSSSAGYMGFHCILWPEDEEVTE
jgi:hypothetical protein